MILAKWFRLAGQNCNSRVQQTFWGKTFLQRWVHIWTFFELWVEKLNFSRKLNNMSVTSAFSASRETFQKENSFFKDFFDNFRTFSRRNLELVKIKRQTCQNCIFVSRKNSEGESFRWKIFKICSVFSALAFEQKKSTFAIFFLLGSWNCFLRVPKTSLARKTFLFEENFNFLHHMRTLSEKFSDFEVQTTAGLSKVHFTCT